MATPVTGIRIPADLLALIDARAIDGKTRTDIVIGVPVANGPETTLSLKAPL